MRVIRRGMERNDYSLDSRKTQPIPEAVSMIDELYDPSSYVRRHNNIGTYFAATLGAVLAIANGNPVTANEQPQYLGKPKPAIVAEDEMPSRMSFSSYIDNVVADNESTPKAMDSRTEYLKNKPDRTLREAIELYHRSVREYIECKGEYNIDGIDDEGFVYRKKRTAKKLWPDVTEIKIIGEWASTTVYYKPAEFLKNKSIYQAYGTMCFILKKDDGGWSVKATCFGSNTLSLKKAKNIGIDSDTVHGLDWTQEGDIYDFSSDSYVSPKKQKDKRIGTVEKISKTKDQYFIYFENGNREWCIGYVVNKGETIEGIIREKLKGAPEEHIRDYVNAIIKTNEVVHKKYGKEFDPKKMKPGDRIYIPGCRQY